MIILGLDPGYAILGYGVIDYTGNKFKVLEYGAIITDKKMEFPSRLEKIYNDLCVIINKYKPQAMSVEKLFFNTNTSTAMAVAQARGCCLLAAKKNNLTVAEYTPIQIKQAVTGYGRAVKSQVMEMTRTLLCLDKIPKPDDAADALAVAICHAHTSSTLNGMLYNNFKNVTIS